MSPVLAASLADLLLVPHVAVVLFVVALLTPVLAGGALGWGWVRRRWLRTTHWLLMLFIAVQAWLGQLCPLTVWEQDLRRIAGQAVYPESFIEHWLRRLLGWQAPWWVFGAAYTGSAALVGLAWRRVPLPPARANRSTAPQPAVRQSSLPRR